VLFAPIFHNGRLAPEERLDFADLAAELSAAGVPAEVCADTAGVLRRSLEEAREGSVVVTMSSGSFEGMPHRVLAALKESESSPDAPR
jgi:UDP-N-acetylmuramate-alanine ligase